MSLSYLTIAHANPIIGNNQNLPTIESMPHTQLKASAFSQAQAKTAKSTNKTKKPTESTVTTNSNDPLEGYNRGVYKMNAGFDKYALRPTAVFYVKYVPSPIRIVLQNFFNNLRDFVSLGNDVLQFKGQASMRTTMRIAINSTLGIAGLLDVAGNLGLPAQLNSFGRTFKFYGWTNSSYIVIPLLGPSTIRDTLGLLPDVFFNPVWYVIPADNYYISYGLFAINIIDIRSQYLSVDSVLNTAIDPYVMVRDGYLQNIGESAYKDNTDVSIDQLINESN